MKYGKMSRPYDPKEGMAKDGEGLPEHTGAKKGGLSDSEHVNQAERYCDGNADGVNVETGWSSKTRFTGKYKDY